MLHIFPGAPFIWLSERFAIFARANCENQQWRKNNACPLSMSMSALKSVLRKLVYVCVSMFARERERERARVCVCVCETAILKLSCANNRKSCKYLNTATVVSAADFQEEERRKCENAESKHNPKTEIDENLFELHLQLSVCVCVCVYLLSVHTTTLLAPISTLSSPAFTCTYRCH